MKNELLLKQEVKKQLRRIIMRVYRNTSFPVLLGEQNNVLFSSVKNRSSFIYCINYEMLLQTSPATEIYSVKICYREFWQAAGRWVE